MTPSWLKHQPWFVNMASSKSTPVVYEEVEVSHSGSNKEHAMDDEQICLETGVTLPKNYEHVFYSAEQLNRQTARALSEGYYPIVVGGDHSQAIGSISGMKKVYKDASIIWIDAHIDANTPESSPSRNIHGMPLSYLLGLVPLQRHWKCLKEEKDLCYFGIRSYEDEEKRLIDEMKCQVFKSEDCKIEDLDKIEDKMFREYFEHKIGQKYWISFDIDGVCGTEFRSTGTCEEGGITIPFIYKLMERIVPQAVGMDFSEVNFQLTRGEQRKKDEEAFRDMF